MAQEAFAQEVVNCFPGSGTPAFEVITLINNWRVSQGLSPLALDPRLARAAQLHSEDYVKNIPNCIVSNLRIDVHNIYKGMTVTELKNEIDRIGDLIYHELIDKVGNGNVGNVNTNGKPNRSWLRIRLELPALDGS
jgi:hypothetical protein